MIRKAKVYRNQNYVGVLTEEKDNTYHFEYDSEYLNNNHLPAVSLTMPKTKKHYKSKFLFPFFFNMLSEGVNRKVQSRQLQISEKDHFGLLLATSSNDSIGAVYVQKIKEND